MTVTEITNTTHGCHRTKTCRVLVLPYLSPTDKPVWMDQEIDYCLADKVASLNSDGDYTSSSCCGHGICPGLILMHSGKIIYFPICSKFK